MVKRKLAVVFGLLIGIGSTVGLAGLPELLEPEEGFPVEELLRKLAAYAAADELSEVPRDGISGEAPLARKVGERAGEAGVALGANSEADPAALEKRSASEPESLAFQTADDLAVLREIIRANGLDETSSGHDYDDGNGVFEPHELGVQVWQEGRLVELRTGPDVYLSFGYELENLPVSIGTLSALRVLDLHTNRLRSLPETIGFLHELRELRLHRNMLFELPPQVWGLRRLQVLSLGHNRIEELPWEIGELAALRELHLNDNPLLELPASLGNLARLELLALQKRLEADVLLPALPPQLGDLLGLATLYLSGNALYCDSDPGHLADFLRAGGIPNVYGLEHQACP